MKQGPVSKGGRFFSSSVTPVVAPSMTETPKGKALKGAITSGKIKKK